MIVFDLPPSEVTASRILEASAIQFEQILNEQRLKLPLCIKQAATHYQLNELVVKALLNQEGGKIGEVKQHANGSVDFGPFQINQKYWLKTVTQQYPTLTWVDLTFDACTNTFVASAILRSEIDKAEGDIWGGVGNYHHAKSSNLKRHYEYTSGVIEKYLRLVQKNINQIFKSDKPEKTP